MSMIFSDDAGVCTKCSACGFYEGRMCYCDCHPSRNKEIQRLTAELSAVKARCESLERAAQRFASEARKAESELAEAKKMRQYYYDLNQSKIGAIESLTRELEELKNVREKGKEWMDRAIIAENDLDRAKELLRQSRYSKEITEFLRSLGEMKGESSAK